MIGRQAKERLNLSVTMKTPCCATLEHCLILSSLPNFLELAHNYHFSFPQAAPIPRVQ